MPSVYDTLTAWARRTTTDFAELLAAGPDRARAEPEATGRIYRLRHWPVLPAHWKTADIYRTLSVMSHRPVNRRWILASSRLRAEQVDQLLQRLVEDGAVDVVDTSDFSETQPSRPD